MRKQNYSDDMRYCFSHYISVLYRRNIPNLLHNVLVLVVHGRIKHVPPYYTRRCQIHKKDTFDSTTKELVEPGTVIKKASCPVATHVTIHDNIEPLVKFTQCICLFFMNASYHGYTA